MNTTIKIPTHIAFIIDGNGRWAKEMKKPRTYGHLIGFRTLKKTIKEVVNLGIKYVSIYAFSTENWNRPKEEVDYLMNLFRKMLKKDMYKEFNNARINIMGNLDLLPKDIKDSAIEIMERTKNIDSCIINIGLNYGGRDEILRATNNLIKLGKTNITQEDFKNQLYTAGQPDPDLIIRTSGEQRISNFMLWQCAYSEFYFPKTYWPAFDKKELMLALEEYSKRNRRFGAIKEG